MRASRTFLFVFLFLVGKSKAQILPTNTLDGHVTISWAFPTNQAAYPGIESNLYPLSFKVYATPSLTSPMTLLTNVDSEVFMPFIGGFVGTNWWASNCAVQCAIQPGSYYFFVASSNFWGESDLSIPAVTPTVPPFIGNTVTIRKLP